MQLKFSCRDEHQNFCFELCVFDVQYLGLAMLLPGAATLILERHCGSPFVCPQCTKVVRVLFGVI